MEQEDKSKFLRVKPETRLRLMQLKEIENLPSINAVICKALDIYETSPRIRVFCGSVLVWSRSA